MKKIIIAALLSAFALPAMAQYTAPEVTVKKFAKEGNMVNVELSVDIDGKTIRPTERWVYYPVIRSGGTERPLPTIVINGNNKRKMERRAEVLGRGWTVTPAPQIEENVHRKDAKTLEYRATVPYEDWMRNSTLVMNTELTSCAHPYNYTDNIGTIYAPAPPKPYVIVPAVIYIQPKQEEIKERAIAATAFIDFAVGRSVINPAFRRNPEELAKIRTTLDDVKNNKDMTFKGIFLEGFASPEGSYANNERLARERVQALKTYISGNFSVPSNVVTTGYTAEDWAGLRKLVESGLQESKDQVLAIIDGTDAPDTKEAKLKQLNGGRPWRVIMDEMMPSLRRTDYRVDFTVKEYDVRDSKEVLKTNPYLLSHYELDALATEYGKGSAEYDQIYGIIERQFPNDDAANLNVAAYKIGKGDYAGAKRNLERVQDKTTAAYYNNYGIVLMMEGKYNDARSMFNKAGNAEARRNIEEIGKFEEIQKQIDFYK